MVKLYLRYRIAILTQELWLFYISIFDKVKWEYWKRHQVCPDRLMVWVDRMK